MYIIWESSYDNSIDFVGVVKTEQQAKDFIKQYTVGMRFSQARLVQYDWIQSIDQGDIDFMTEENES